MPLTVMRHHDFGASFTAMTTTATMPLAIVNIKTTSSGVNEGALLVRLCSDADLRAED